MATTETLFNAPLSRRERSVLQGAILGWRAQEIAWHMGIEVHTVKTHLRGIRLKFNEQSASTHRIVAECFRTGFISPFDVRQP